MQNDCGETRGRRTRLKSVASGGTVPPPGRQDSDDAVMIAAFTTTWHTTMALDAMKAGKEVALEMPITRTIREGQQLTAAAGDARPGRPRLRALAGSGSRSPYTEKQVHAPQSYAAGWDAAPSDTLHPEVHASPLLSASPRLRAGSSRCPRAALGDAPGAANAPWARGPRLCSSSFTSRTQMCGTAPGCRGIAG